jgi:hypothetical protein
LQSGGQASLSFRYGYFGHVIGESALASVKLILVTRRSQSTDVNLYNANMADGENINYEESLEKLEKLQAKVCAKILQGVVDSNCVLWILTVCRCISFVSSCPIY